MSSQKQWDNVADLFDRKMGESGDNLNGLLIQPKLLELLGDLKEKIVLDVGCGSGYYSRQLALLADKVDGTDFSDNFIKICRKKYSDVPNIRFFQHDLSDVLPFNNLTYDIVIAKMVLQYVPSIELFAAESYRLLKPDGKLIFAVDHPFHAQFYYAQRLAGKFDKHFITLDNYFSDKPQTKLSLWLTTKLTWYPRTISSYINTFTNIGFNLGKIIELPEEKDSVIIPRILILSFNK
jgi:ubiquinone/menaquinone biosynthesis C-methylase UbiE